MRVRATNLPDFPDIPGALLDMLPDPHAAVTVDGDKGILTNGKLRAEIWADGTLHFFKRSTGAVLLEEPEPIFNKPPARWYRPLQAATSQRSSAFPRPARRAHLWPGAAPARPARQQGLRDRPGAAQHRGLHPLLHLQPGLRLPVE